jgi:hypothetical protein
MLNNILSLFWTCFFSKFYFFKAVTLLCTLYLLYKEFCLFFIDKPTSTSTESIKLAETFPHISICPVVGLNLEQFNANGYWYEYAYFSGYFAEGNFYSGMDSLSHFENLTKNSSQLLSLAGLEPTIKIQII